MFYGIIEMEHWLKWIKRVALFFTKRQSIKKIVLFCSSVF